MKIKKVLQRVKIHIILNIKKIGKLCLILAIFIV